MTTEPAATRAEPAHIEAVGVRAWFGKFEALKGVSMAFDDGRVTALIGPSGCGKSTFLRTLNRMHETVPGARMEGDVRLDGDSIYAAGVDPVAIRRRVGMVFQKPNPFPTLSIRENVLAGLAINGFGDEKPDEVLERTLRGAALWDEVKDILDRSGTSISGGQQQRLCIARALALKPEVLLMDEPCSALDPISTEKVEDLILSLRGTLTIAVVTHNLQQARRIAEATAFFYLGELVEFAPTNDLFERPRMPRTIDYVSGRFG